MTCTTPDCERATSTYLCTQCVSDLQAWIDQVPRLLPELDVTIARLDVTRPGNSETRSSNVAGSAAPANLDALELKARLQSVTHTAAEYAQEDHAAGTAWIIQEWCKNAELLISGPEEIRIVTTHIDCGGNVTTTNPRPQVTDNNPDPTDAGTCQSCGNLVSTSPKKTAARVNAEAPPMITRRLIPWLREHARIHITRADINNWRQRGHLHPVAHEPTPTYRPADVVNVYQNKGRE